MDFWWFCKIMKFWSECQKRTWASYISFEAIFSKIILHILEHYTWTNFATANINAAFFPPNSKLSFFINGTATLAMWQPIKVEPVKEITLTSGGCTTASLALDPRPWIRFKTPRGTPTSWKTCRQKKRIALKVRKICNKSLKKYVI